jgi:hypothetical protein
MSKLYISDVENFLYKQFKKPLIPHPAVYVPPGKYNLSSIPYKVCDPYESITIKKTDSHKAVKVMVGSEICNYYLVNKNFKSPNICRFSKNSHLEFGYGLTALPKIPELPFIEKFKIPETENIGSWWDECKKSAVDIKNRYGDIYLCLSGGLDSELMALAFIEAGVDFIPFTMVYKHNDEVLNEHDIKTAVDLCKRFDLTLRTKDVYILNDLYDNRHRDYFIKGIYETYFLLPYLYTQQYMIEYINSIGGVPIMASDQVEMKMNSKNEVCIGDCSYSIGLSAPTWVHLTNNVCVYDFFMYSPEQVFSYISIPEVLNTTTVDYDFKRRISMKYGSKHLNFYEKVTGYEFVKEALFKHHNKELHELTIATIQDIDWRKKPMSQFIHPIKDIVTDKSFANWQVIRTTTNDFLARGFKEDDKDYYDI